MCKFAIRSILVLAVAAIAALPATAERSVNAENGVRYRLFKRERSVDGNSFVQGQPRLSQSLIDRWNGFKGQSSTPAPQPPTTPTITPPLPPPTGPTTTTGGTPPTPGGTTPTNTPTMTVPPSGPPTNTARQEPIEKIDFIGNGDDDQDDDDDEEENYRFENIKKTLDSQLSSLLDDDDRNNDDKKPSNGESNRRIEKVRAESRAQKRSTQKQPRKRALRADDDNSFRNLKIPLEKSKRRKNQIERKRQMPNRWNIETRNPKRTPAARNRRLQRQHLLGESPADIKQPHKLKIQKQRKRRRRNRS